MASHQSALRIPHVTIITALLLIGFFTTAPAEGGTISITSQATLSVTGESLRGSFQVTNLGTAPAHRVRAEISLPREVVRTSTKHKLDPGESVTFPLEAELEDIKRGTHPVAILIRFQDDKGYPFTAISCATFSYRQRAESELLCTGEPLTMTATGTVRFRLENPGARPRAVRATLVLPREFSSLRDSVDLMIEGRSQKAASFAVCNLGALQGASYPVFCFVEFDQGDTHHTQVCSTTLEVASGDNWFRGTRWTWAGGMVLLLVAFGLWRAFSSRRR